MVLPFLLGLIPILGLVTLIYFITQPVLILTDPVWGQAVLEGEKGFLTQLRLSELNSFRRIEVREIALSPIEQENDRGENSSKNRDIREQIFHALLHSKATCIVLSPGLSNYVDIIDSDFPDKTLIGFSGSISNGLDVKLVSDLEDAMFRGGLKTAQLLESWKTEEGGNRSFALGPIALVTTEETEEGNRYASAFLRGLEEGNVGGDNRDIEIFRGVMEERGPEEQAEVGDFLREHGVDEARFVWFWGKRAAAQVLSTLQSWKVSSLVVGDYAHEAYPDTVAIGIRYAWKDALKKAIDMAMKVEESASPKDPKVIRMGGIVDFYPKTPIP